MELHIDRFPIALAFFDAHGNRVEANSKWHSGLDVHVHEAMQVGINRMERNVTDKNGETKRYDITVQHDEGWKVTVCAQEILYTDEKEKAEYTLQWQLEYQSRLMFDAAPLSISLVDESLDVLDCNQEYMRRFSKDNNLPTYQDLHHLMPEVQPNGLNSMEMLEECIALALETGRANIELICKDKNGYEFPADVAWASTTFNGRRVLVEFLTDITEKHEARQRAREAERLLHKQEAFDRMRQMLDAAPVVIEYWNRDGKIIDCNQTALDFYGFKTKAEYTDEVPVTEISTQPGGETSALFRAEQLKNIFETGSTHCEYAEKKVNGEYIVLQVDGVRINMDGEVMAITYSSDITPLKRANEEMERASRAKGSFLSIVSHEMRTPINAIIGMNSIARKEKDEQKRNAAIEKVSKAATHLLGLINDVLDMSKIEAGKFELHITQLDLHFMLQKVCTLVEFPMQAKNHSFSMNIAENVPPYYYGDDQRLTQILTNLLSNAVNNTPSGGKISLDVSVLEQSKEEATLQFVITDNGVGIAPKDMARLFETFERLGNSSTTGTGLGLPISRRLASLMGGDITVESEQGKYSSFFITVKLELCKEITTTDDTPFAADFLEGKRMLLVEDMEINREIFLANMEDTGLLIDIAHDGQEAVDIITENTEKYDIIFMDLQMPKMDGLQATRAIRALPHPRAKTLPIIAMTADVFTDSINRCHEAGMNGHVGKPLDMNAIYKVLHFVLDNTLQLK
jgi:PAS domain S-box-containing protein